ncbi:exosome complex component RRP42 [Pancytospora epiphaga]|nr:exosome complex component RRP42 [Pancytospora epiphaga]
MKGISEGETMFVKMALERNVRLDSRSFTQGREWKYEKNNLPVTDGSLYLQAGHTSLTLSVMFTTTLTKLLDVSPIEFKFVGISVSSSASINSFLARDWAVPANSIFGKLYSLLDSLSLTALIEIEVLQDDGNVFDLVFTGLSSLFSTISFPNIVDLANPIPASLVLPTSRTFVVYNNELISDPTFLEERTLEVQIHAFYESDGRLLTVFLEGPIDTGFLKDLLCKIC